MCACVGLIATAAVFVRCFQRLPLSMLPLSARVWVVAIRFRARVRFGYLQINVILREEYSFSRDVAKHLVSNYGTRALQVRGRRDGRGERGEGNRITPEGMGDRGGGGVGSELFSVVFLIDLDGRIRRPEHRRQRARKSLEPSRNNEFPASLKTTGV